MNKFEITFSPDKRTFSISGDTIALAEYLVNTSIWNENANGDRASELLSAYKTVNALLTDLIAIETDPEWGDSESPLHDALGCIFLSKLEELEDDETVFPGIKLID